MRDYIDGRSRRKTMLRLICISFFNVLGRIVLAGRILPKKPGSGPLGFLHSGQILSFDAWWRPSIFTVDCVPSRENPRLVFVCPFTRPKIVAMFFSVHPPVLASVSDLIRDVGNELTTYSSQMTTTHWGIVAGCAVAFGFLCLKGSGVNR